MHFKEEFFSPPLVSWTGIAVGLDLKHSYYNNKFAKFIPNTKGWTWLAPILPNKCAWTRLAIKGIQTFSPPTSLEGYSAIEKIKKVNVRWRLFRPLCKEGLILCGDAAGILDPAAGQGILNALYSGIQAGQTVISCLNKPDYENIFLAQYDSWFL